MGLYSGPEDDSEFPVFQPGFCSQSPPAPHGHGHGHGQRSRPRKRRAGRPRNKQARPPALHGFRFHRDHTVSATVSVNGQRPRIRASGIGRRVAACGCFRDGPAGLSGNFRLNREHTATVSEKAGWKPAIPGGRLRSTAFIFTGITRPTVSATANGLGNGQRPTVSVSANGLGNGQRSTAIANNYPLHGLRS